MEITFEKSPERLKLDNIERQQARHRAARLDEELRQVWHQTQFVDAPALAKLNARAAEIGDPEDIIRHAEQEQAERSRAAMDRHTQASNAAVAARTALAEASQRTGIASEEALAKAEVELRTFLEEAKARAALMDQNIASFKLASIEFNKAAKVKEEARRAAAAVDEEGRIAVADAARKAAGLKSELKEIEAQVRAIGDPTAKRRAKEEELRQAKREAGLL